MNQWWTTKVLGEDGIIRDLGRLEYLPKDVWAKNAWTEAITEEEHEATVAEAQRKRQERT